MKTEKIHKEKIIHPVQKRHGSGLLQFLDNRLPNVIQTVLKQPAQQVNDGKDTMQNVMNHRSLIGSCVKEGKTIQCHKEKQVDERTLRRLQRATLALMNARFRTPHGAGNLVHEIDDSRGESQARLLVSQSHELDAHRRVGRVLSPNENELLRAACATNAGGANCQEYAAMTYAYLTSRGTDAPVTTRLLRAPIGHVYTMIGDPRMSADENHGEVVTVDAWPSEYQAHTHADSRWPEGDVVATYNDNRPSRSAFEWQRAVDRLYTPLGSGATDGMNAYGLTTNEQQTRFLTALQTPPPNGRYRYGYSNQYSTITDETYHYFT